MGACEWKKQADRSARCEMGACRRVEVGKIGRRRRLWGVKLS